MKIVIDISDEDYKAIKEMRTNFGISFYMAIQNGTPLPKGHGDLIDRDKLDCDSDWSDWTDDFMAVSWSQINNAEAIIEAEEVTE